MGQMKNAVKVLLTIGVSAGAMAFGSGCADSTPPTQANASNLRGDVTDVRPIEPAAPAAYRPPTLDNSGLIPTAQQPITPEPMITSTPAAGTPSMAGSASVQTIGEKSHTVRRGETLFSIARSSYGDGKAWKKIVAANPGVSPSKLKVGQVLAMP